jgi:hypothetical protein
MAGLALGDRGAQARNTDAAQTLREAGEHRALPAMIAVAVVHNDMPRCVRRTTRRS